MLAKSHSLVQILLGNVVLSGFQKVKRKTLHVKIKKEFSLYEINH